MQHITHLCYNKPMDTTIRNLDETMYRQLEARAALTGKTIGEMVNEAIRWYLARPDGVQKQGSLRDFKPESYPEGNERLSEEIDAAGGRSAVKKGHDESY